MARERAYQVYEHRPLASVRAPGSSPRWDQTCPGASAGLATCGGSFEDSTDSYCANPVAFATEVSG